MVTWSNQEEIDEASVEYILTMVDIEIESTTPEAAIFEDMIEEDNDQDNTEAEDDNNIWPIVVWKPLTTILVYSTCVGFGWECPLRNLLG